MLNTFPDCPVGRILRQKHDFSPIVVDIISSHDNFQRQWVKRKSFYKKQNYKIIQTNSIKYDPDVSTWNTTYESQTYNSKNNNLNKNISSLSSHENNRNFESESESENELEDDIHEIKGKCLLTFKMN